MGFFDKYNFADLLSTVTNGLFPKKQSEARADISNVELAQGILDCLTMVGTLNDPVHVEAQKVIDAAAKAKGGKLDLQEMYLYCINDLIGTPKNKEEQLLQADLYNCCHTEYTLYAIDAYEKYMKMEPDESKYPYATLGQLQERTHNYEKALEYYKKMLEYDHDTHFPYLYIAEAYRKMNQLDKSIEWMLKARKHPGYKDKSKDSPFMNEVVDNFLADYIEKQRRGYVFRQRAHKPFLPL